MYFILFFKYLLVFHCCYLSGKFLRSVISLELKAGILETFINVFVGLIQFTLVYSLIKSDLKTSLILSLPILIYFFILNKVRFKSFEWKKVNFTKEILPFYIILILLFIYQSISYFDFSTFEFKFLFIDNYTYANIVSVLHDFGVENIDYGVNNYLPSFRDQVMPYRYADLWLSSFVMDFVQVSDIEAFYLIVTPLLISLVSYFFFTLLYDINHKMIFSFFLSLLLLFVSITFIPMLNPWDKLPYISETCIMGTFQQKLSFSVLFFILGIYYWRISRENGLLFFICVPLLYVAYLPAIWGGVILYLVIKFFKGKEKLNTENYSIRLLFLMILILGIYWIFYNINGMYFISFNTMNFMGIPIVKRLPKELIDPNASFTFKGFVANFFFYSLPQIYFYLKGAIGNLLIGASFFLPFILMLFSKFREYLSEIKFILIILFVGICVTVIKDGDYNNYQFFTNSLVLISILISIVFIVNYSRNSLNYIFISVILLFNLLPIIQFKQQVSTHKVDTKFINQVNQLIKHNKSETILCFVDESSFDGSFYSWVGGNVLLPLMQFSSNKISFSIANPEVFFVKNSREDLDYSYYWNIVSNWKHKHPTQNVTNFIDENKIKFLLFYPNVKIPSEINKRVIKTIYSNKYRFVEIILDVSH